MGTERLLTLSLVNFLKTELTNSGWNNVTFVPYYPENDNKIVMSGTGAEDEVVIPAISLQLNSSIEGNLIGIGEGTREHFTNVAVTLFSETAGQEQGLRSFLAERLYRGEIYLKDYSMSGYPGTGNEQTVGPIIIDRISHYPLYAPYHRNAAVRYAGVVNFSTLCYI